ncbi:hypothetical protein, partial [Luteibacter rhizovicinus]|uniref:hypothetical protein n=1 Tax=Luteibacter rhizovicinus TaxID=242606 RepID=UPI001A9D793A
MKATIAVATTDRLAAGSGVRRNDDEDRWMLSTQAQTRTVRTDARRYGEELIERDRDNPLHRTGLLPACMDRGHSAQVCGDIAHTLRLLVQVDNGQVVM